MPTLSNSRLQTYRSATFRLPPHQPLRSAEDAVAFVEERGFTFFWPITNFTLPSLWVAVAGDRPVADEHDDAAHVTWGWKDELLGARRWYYAKVLRRRSTMIAFSHLPYFYALTENYGAPTEDYLLQYAEGRLSAEAKGIYETLLDEGPMDIVALKTRLGASARSTNHRFNRAIEELQVDFKILPVGIARAGAWRYAFVYDLTHRFYPDLPDQARAIDQDSARVELAQSLFSSVGAAKSGEVTRLMGWRTADTERALSRLEASGVIRRNVTREGFAGTWSVLVELIEPSSDSG